MENNWKNTKEELEALSCHNLAEKIPFGPAAVPDGYWDELSNRVLENVLTQHFSRENVYAVPDGYFEAFTPDVQTAEQPLELTPENELADIAPFLYKAAAQKETPYRVPQGYFSHFKVEKAKVAPKKAILHYFYEPVFRYVAAAVLLILFSVIGGRMIYEKEQIKNYAYLKQMNVSQALAEVNENDILGYLNAGSIDKETNPFYGYGIYPDPVNDIHPLLENTSNEEIENYLKITPSVD